MSSLELLQEFVETMRDFKIEMPEDVIQEWRTMIIENSVMVVAIEKFDIVKNDPDDNKFFETALAGKAQYIISQDRKHVLNISEFKEIKTIHPENFLRLLRG